MTLTLLLAILSGWTALSFAQGEITFANNAATTITNAGGAWWGPNPSFLRVAVYGATGDNQPESSLALQLSAVTNLNAPGRFFGGTRVLNLPTGRSTLQIRAWEASSPYENYEDAVAAGLGGDGSVVIGASRPFSLTLTAPLAPPTPIATQGLQPFGVNPIPEPSVFAIGLVGALVLWPLLRRWRS